LGVKDSGKDKELGSGIRDERQDSDPKWIIPNPEPLSPNPGF